MKDLCDRRGVPAAILLCRTEANTTALRDALAWIDDAGIACFETLIRNARTSSTRNPPAPAGPACTSTATWQPNSSGPCDSSRGRTCEEHEFDAPSARPDHAAHRRPAGTGGYRKTGIGGNRNTEKPEDRETERRGGWVKTSVSLRASTRRRLKTWAAEHDMRIQEVVDAALETYLGLK